MENVINFAEAQRLLKEREEKLEVFAKESDKEIADIFALEASRDIVVALHDIGIHVTDNPKCILDIFSLQETIHGLIYRCLGEPHHYHDVSDSITITSLDGSDVRVDYDELLEEFMQAMYSDDGI
jgi:hypothetical protein